MLHSIFKVPLSLFLAFGSLQTMNIAFARDCSWPFRIPVQLDIGTTANTEEIRINLTSADFPSTYTFSTAGEDVRVYAEDEITAIDHFVTSWDATTRTATIYIQPGILAAGSTSTFNIEIGNTAAPSVGNVTSVFPDIGLRLHSRVTTADPVSPETALASFAAATTDVYNDVRSSVTNLSNQALGGTSGNFAWCISALIEVTPADAGIWEFRYGPDFGRGGHLFVAENQLDEQWNDDIFWGFSYANTAETLEGAVNLSPGWHRYEALGFEGCCDGRVGWQGRKPGGAFQDLNTTNFSMRAARCVSPEVTVTVLPSNSCTTILNAAKLATITSDPASSIDPYALPGSIVSYEIRVENPGVGIDANTINLTDILPNEVALIATGATAFEFIDGSPPSNLSLNWGGAADTTDNVEFSTDGIDFTYTPSSAGPNNSDPLITHVRFRPAGSFSPYNSNIGRPFFIVRFSVVIK